MQKHLSHMNPTSLTLPFQGICSARYDFFLAILSSFAFAHSKLEHAIDALTLDYSVKFRFSLVLSRKNILRYQLLFRFLLHLKHVEQSLADRAEDEPVEASYA
jgi:hypothetical protein